MKKIYFDDISNLKKNWPKLSVLILSLIMILFGTFTDILSENWNKWIKASGFLLFSIYFLSKVLRKNYVQWNKKGAVVRINSFMGKSLRFDEIKMTELIEKKLIITKDNGNTVTFDLNEIAESDTQKLNEIIVKNTIANNV